jgi:glycerol-3-phosphate O-acyltransferase
VHIPRADRDYAIEVGLRMLKLRHLVIEDENGYRPEPGETMLLQYYANAIAHLLPSPSAEVVELAPQSTTTRVPIGVRR